MPERRPSFDNEWLRQGSTGPVPLGDPSRSEPAFRQMPIPTPRDLVLLGNAALNTWQRGEPVFRLVAALRHKATLMMFEGKVCTNLQWISDFFDPESPLFAPFARVNHVSSGVDNTVALNAAMTFGTMQAHKISDEPAWFELREDLAYSLLGTRLTGVRPSDVRLPLPGFYIELPPGLMTLQNNLTGRHEVRCVCVCEGFPHQDTDVPLPPSANDVGYGRRLLVIVYCEPNEHSVTPEDDNILYFSLPLFEETKTIEELIDYDHSVTGHDWRDDAIGGAFAGVDRTNLQLRNLLRSFVVNFLLYLSAPESDIRHKHADRMATLRRGKKTRRVREQIRRLQAKPLWVVGSRVVVDPAVKAAVQHAGTKRGSQRAVNVLVMGYWRRQWVGPKTEANPKGSDWYMREIKPYVRNKIEGKPIFAHEYKVRGTRG